MSLIIAIEPDRDQAAQLKDLVRRHTAAELILADTTEHAISAIGQRIPDLVLIPAFLSPQDDEALTSALRATHAAAHVQTLTIPVLGTPQQPKSVPQSVLSRLLGDQPRPASPDSCDPKIFAEQISEYLERVAKDRPLSGNGNGHLPQSPSSGPSPNSGVRKPKAAAPPPQPPPKHESRSGVKKAIPLPASNLSKPPEPPATDVAALEAALAQVTLDASSSKPSSGAGPAGDEADALVMGLTSLMERLNAEDRAAATPPAAAAPAPAPAAHAPAPPAAPPRAVPEPVKTVVAPPAASPKTSAAQSPAVEPTAWKELKALESLEYAMPKNVLPRDEDKADPAPATPAPEPAPKKSSGGSEWGDLMESLKKDLGR